MSPPSNERSLTGPHLHPSSQPPLPDDPRCDATLPVDTPAPQFALVPLPPPSRASPSTRQTTSESNAELLDIPPQARSYPSSRRTSNSSDDDGSRNSRSPMLISHGASRAPSSRSRSISADDSINTQTAIRRFAIVPDDASLIVSPEEVEQDDYLHNPDPMDSSRDFHFWSKRGIVNVGGLGFVVLGVLTLFIASPVITLLQRNADKSADICERDPMCLGVDSVPLMKNVRTGLIDPDTPESARKIQSAEDGKEWELVFSDEFNRDGRTFFPGDDPYLQAVDLWYGVTFDLEWYDPDAVTTKDGVLELRFDAFRNHGLDYRSGMVQSWNQLCFKGGRLEASISLPGRGDTVGFWPGFWAMGNLGRPGYAATTEGMWPYSYVDKCDAGITPNQSSPDGMSFLPGMKLPACTCKGEDHPNRGKSRSAPEIDVLEASVHPLSKADSSKKNRVGDVSQSCQIAPYDIWYMPNYDFMEVYDPRITSINSYRGSPLQQAISGVTNLNNDWYDGKDYQVYAFEYEPGAGGYVTWFVGEDKTWKLDGRALGPNGNIDQRVVPVEPMSIVMNFGMSHSFSALDLADLKKLMPATMRIDYLRIYQDPKRKSVTCDPPGWETTEYIRKHKEPYMNWNLTMWSDTDWEWPRNSLMHGCS